MNLKRIFGALLTALGIGGLIYTAILFVNSTNSNYAIKTLVVFGILGILFFSAGINLISKTKDEA